MRGIGFGAIFAFSFATMLGGNWFNAGSELQGAQKLLDCIDSLDGRTLEQYAQQHSDFPALSEKCDGQEGRIFAQFKLSNLTFNNGDGLAAAQAEAALPEDQKKAAKASLGFDSPYKEQMLADATTIRDHWEVKRSYHKLPIDEDANIAFFVGGATVDIVMGLWMASNPDNIFRRWRR
jgi:hypothetical protein